MLAIVEAALAFTPVAEKLITAGIGIAGVVSQIRAGLDANAAPDNTQWQAADAAVNALMVRALDPATDSR